MSRCRSCSTRRCGLRSRARRSYPARWYGAWTLGTSAAQSAIAAYWPRTGALHVLAAFPRRPGLDERGRLDGVAGLYRECARRGELLTLGERATDIPALLAVALNRFGKPSRVVADRWREAELRDALEKAGIPPGAAFEVRGMGFKDGAEDVRAFRRGCAEGRVTPAPSLLLRSAMSEARTIADPAGNAKLSKGDAGWAAAAGARRRRQRRRVGGRGGGPPAREAAPALALPGGGVVSLARE